MPQVAEAVCSLWYAGWLYGHEIPELKVLHGQFTAKYGAAHAHEVIEHKEKYLNNRLVRMLTSTKVPDSSVVELYLTEIAKTYGVVGYTPRPPLGAFGAAPSPISATIGRPLPLPGMPVGSFDCAPPLPGPAEVPGALSYYPAVAMPISDPTRSGLPYAHASCDGPSACAPSGNRSDGPVFFSIVLQKTPSGFGMSLSRHNVVTAIKPGSEAERGGLIQCGDQVLQVNGCASMAGCGPHPSLLLG